MRTLTRNMMAGLAALVGLNIATPAIADPDCSGPNRWPSNMAFAQLKNVGVLDPASIDPSRTTSVQIASEKIGNDLYRQVFRVKFFLKNGNIVQAIAISDSSKEECSISNVTIYRVVGLSK